MKIESLEAIARDMVGDGKRPNVFFVSLEPLGIVMITRDFQAAYQYWKGLSRSAETSLEDRQTGVICSNEPLCELDKRLHVIDDSASFLKRHPHNQRGF